MMDGLTPDECLQAELLVEAFCECIAAAPNGRARAARDPFLAELDQLATPAARAVALHIRTARARRAARLGL
jgi:hypothetical protein